MNGPAPYFCRSGDRVWSPFLHLGFLYLFQDLLNVNQLVPYPPSLVLNLFKKFFCMIFYPLCNEINIIISDFVFQDIFFGLGLLSWSFGWLCHLNSSFQWGFMCRCVPPSLFFRHWGIILLSHLPVLIWGASLLLLRCLLTGLPLLCSFLVWSIASYRFLGQPRFHLFSLGHVLGDDLGLPFLFAIFYFLLNFLFVDAESKLYPFFLWILMRLDSHVVSHSLKIGYPLVLHDHFRSYPPCLCHVVLYVTKIPSKSVGITTSPLGIRSASHRRVLCCSRSS
jgi:hypothetical protein